MGRSLTLISLGQISQIIKERLENMNMMKDLTNVACFQNIYLHAIENPYFQAK